MMELLIRAIFRTKAIFWTKALLDELEAVVPLIIILIYPMDSLGSSFSRRGTCSCGRFVLSLLTNLCNFPCLISASICCF